MKMVITDLDGTLLASDKTISERTQSILAKLKTQHIEFVIATARPPRFVMGYLPLDFSSIHVVCCNGADIYSRGSQVGHMHINPSVAEGFIHQLLLMYPGINLSVEMGNHLTTNFDISRFSGWLPPYTQVDFRSFEFQPVSKILVGMSAVPNPEEISSLLPAECAMVITDRGTLGQVTHREASKLHGIEAIASLLSLSLTDAIAFGDDYSDIDMIQHCGTGVAMGNAPEDIKRLADIVAPTNDEDGVAVVLEKLMD